MTRSGHRRSAVFAAAVLLVGAGAASAASAAGLVPPRDPTSNIAPIPDYNIVAGRPYAEGSPLPTCWAWRDGRLAIHPQSAACVRAEIEATNHARRREGVGAFTLPRNFALLGVDEQLLVLVDLERVARGEVPVLGLSQTANVMAQRGALANQDPTLSTPRDIAGATGGWMANWAAAESSLDANYSWMYVDGWGGKGGTINFTCTSPSAPGCWGHRNNILVNSMTLPCYADHCSLVMGAGYAPHNWDVYNSYSELIVQVAGTTPPALMYTWHQALAAGARP